MFGDPTDTRLEDMSYLREEVFVTLSQNNIEVTDNYLSPVLGGKAIRNIYSEHTT